MPQLNLVEQIEKDISIGKARILLTKTGDILLENDQAKLRITSQGEILIVAKKITAMSVQDLSLKGDPIKLNCDNE